MIRHLVSAVSIVAAGWLGSWILTAYLCGTAVCPGCN